MTRIFQLTALRIVKNLPYSSKQNIGFVKEEKIVRFGKESPKRRVTLS